MGFLVSFGNDPAQSRGMSAAFEFPWTAQDPKADLRPVFECSPIGLAQCEPHGNIIAANPAMEQILGSKVRTRSLLLADLVDPENRAETERMLGELFEHKRDSFQIDSASTAPDSRRLRWTAWRIAGTEGNLNCLLALTEGLPQNLPPNLEADRRLRQTERLEAVGRLAGGVAHDFNNLLTGVLLYCDLLIAGLEPGHSGRKYAEEIRNAGLQATGMVQQLLAVARPTNCQPRLLSLNEIAEGMHNLLVRLIGENIELILHLDSNLGLIRMDPAQAQQILLNLVLNARDAMPGGGQITIETSNAALRVLPERSFGAAKSAVIPCALFVVEDTGSGMDAATRMHLFEAFFTTKATGKGTGLGLATVHDIVTGNGGLIHVDSAPDFGTRVTVLLPLVPTAATNSQQLGTEQIDTQETAKKNEGAIPAGEKEQTP